MQLLRAVFCKLPAGITIENRSVNSLKALCIKLVAREAVLAWEVGWVLESLASALQLIYL